MAREICKKPASITVRPIESITAKISLLTPVFGGGAESKKLDEDFPIRGASVKGQLRFWWRAARAGGKTLEEMKEEEARLWGGPSCNGVVSLSIDANRVGCSKKDVYEVRTHNGKRKAEPKKGFDDLAYFAFPLRPTDAEIKQGARPSPVFDLSGSFTLTLHVNDKHPNYLKGDEVEAKAALWAWRHFGGIGGRTRRGFGALDLPTDEVMEHSDERLTHEYIIDKKPPEGVPSLASCSGAKVAFVGGRDAEDAWKKLARKFKHFRQGNGTGRNHPQSGKHAGRSRWPEPDVIRHELRGRFNGANAHKQRITKTNKAPRGQFGLPIIFHFQEKIDDVELTLRGKERFASPLILRPVGTKANAKAMVLILGNRPALDDAVMEQGKHSYSVQTQLTNAEALEIRPLNNEPDPLVAFMNYFS